jgi:hypothetical protein
MRARISLLLPFVLLLALASCSQRLSRDQAEEAIIKGLKNTAIPMEWIEPEPGMPDWGLAHLTSIDMVDARQIGKFDDKKKSCSVKARVKGTVTVGAALYGTYTRPLDHIMWFDVSPYIAYTDKGKKQTKWSASFNYQKSGVKPKVKINPIPMDFLK